MSGCLSGMGAALGPVLGAVASILPKLPPQPVVLPKPFQPQVNVLQVSKHRQR
jgi:hypothetical protein